MLYVYFPILCGVLSLVSSEIYLLERNSILHIVFVKKHEYQIGIISSVFALAGIVLGLILVKFSTQNIFIKIGIILSIIALLFSTLGM